MELNYNIKEALLVTVGFESWDVSTVFWDIMNHWLANNLVGFILTCYFG